ncbi:hypothetical protein MKW98_012624 [Papaver atlanticum]|uniref:Uncharacterized protein n=1 Tax=Papaver atlanticum TaxID=357466 RepID=A0AAD4T246_9MAGN|nr:hypothetical protein MKW98_012624 [Papaver atlanticum]
MGLLLDLFSFDDLNTERLRIAARGNADEAETFYFDPKCINWGFLGLANSDDVTPTPPPSAPAVVCISFCSYKCWVISHLNALISFLDAKGYENTNQKYQELLLSS